MEYLAPQPGNIIRDSESIKLTKNSRGYSWEVKLLEIDLDRLRKLNQQMEEEYGTRETSQSAA